MIFGIRKLTEQVSAMSEAYCVSYTGSIREDSCTSPENPSQ